MDELKAMIQKMDTKMNQMNKILTLHARILYFKIRQVDIKIRSTEENSIRRLSRMFLSWNVLTVTIYHTKELWN